MINSSWSLSILIDHKIICEYLNCFWALIPLWSNLVFFHFLDRWHKHNFLTIFFLHDFVSRRPRKIIVILQYWPRSSNQLWKKPSLYCQTDIMYLVCKGRLLLRKWRRPSAGLCWIVWDCNNYRPRTIQLKSTKQLWENWQLLVCTDGTLSIAITGYC